MMRSVSLRAAGVALGLLVACGKPPAPAPPVVVAPQPAPVAPVAPEPAAPASEPAPGGESPAGVKIEDRMPTAPHDSSKSNPVDRKFTEALHHYLEANGKLPPDFNALVTAKLIPQVPTPPPGKRYAIDRRNLQVVILDQ